MLFKRLTNCWLPFIKAKDVKNITKATPSKLKNSVEIPLFILNFLSNFFDIGLIIKANNPLDIVSTAVVALTSERILIGRKRVVFGYFLDSITPDMFNDLKVLNGIIWGKIHLDTVKEFVTLSNISKNALSEIETKISSFMMEEKKKYGYKPKIKKTDF